MSKPLGYYTASDNSYLEELQQKYGAAFEQMTQREKLYLMGVIASQLCVELDGETRNEIYELGTVINQRLEASDRAGLIEAMISQVRWGQNAELAHHS